MRAVPSRGSGGNFPGYFLVLQLAMAIAVCLCIFKKRKKSPNSRDKPNTKRYTPPPLPQLPTTTPPPSSLTSTARRQLIDDKNTLRVAIRVEVEIRAYAGVGV